MSELPACLLSAKSAASRHPCALPTSCHPPLAWGDKEAWPATICDIAPAGLTLALARRFERGSGLAIELPSAYGPSTVLARVAQVRPGPAGGWQLDCSLLSPLSEEEVEALLALDRAHHAPARTDAGTWEDIDLSDGDTVPIAGVLFQVALRPGEVLRWFVKRLSLVGGWPLARGKSIALQFVDTPSDTFPVEIEVYHCRWHQDHWVVNGHFTTLPAPAVLRALGQAGA